MEAKNMSDSDVLQEVLSALNSYASPGSLTKQIVGKVINSKQLKTAVRKVIIDPVQSKFVPHIGTTGYDQSMELFNALITLFPKEQLVDILGETEANVERLVSSLQTESPYWPLRIWCYDMDTPLESSKLVRYKNALLYITCSFTENKLVWGIDFVSSTKDVYNEFTQAIKDAREYINVGFSKKFERRIRIVQMSGRGGRTQTSYTMVPNTIVINKEVNAALDQVIAAVNASDGIKNEYSVNKTIGVLLYGPGGTGKSTIARYLAMKLGRTLILTGANDLEEVIDYAKDRSSGRTGNGEKFIILIEDIDFKFIDRRKLAKKKPEPSEETKPKAEDEDDDDDDDEAEAISFGGAIMHRTDTLFQLLDGVLSDSNLMVVATTNYFDRLDPALIRDGRFDHKIEVLGLSREDAIGVCENFKVTPEEIGIAAMSEPINPGTLQTLILKYKTSVKPVASE